ncbi:ATP synthase subunit I [Thermobacillus xylanilyticus]|uniref:ATP synthase subunit I n=1 Tax=Thermobacillus xylanilyticus TaxID=76633 RepID=A0ABM8V7Z7_THEXY|nr:ATP synthase subunit I [Thermobacillus xylanilyticus]CAG5091397.1 ATP synthase subunit I [Thermobacillus xylanilyticus]
MNDILRRAVRLSLFTMSALLMAWALYPEGRTVAAGLLLGICGSLVNAFLLRRRVEMIARSALEGGKRTSLGLASRLAVILLAVMACYRFPEYFSLPATLAACFYVQFAVFFFAAVHNRNVRNGKG